MQKEEENREERGRAGGCGDLPSYLDLQRRCLYSQNKRARGFDADYQFALRCSRRITNGPASKCLGARQWGRRPGVRRFGTSLDTRGHVLAWTMETVYMYEVVLRMQGLGSYVGAYYVGELLMTLQPRRARGRKEPT
jgi:hypothetical protein